jgi:hypothetical protein
MKLMREGRNDEAQTCSLFRWLVEPDDDFHDGRMVATGECCGINVFLCWFAADAAAGGDGGDGVDRWAAVLDNTDPDILDVVAFDSVLERDFRAATPANVEQAIGVVEKRLRPVASRLIAKRARLMRLLPILNRRLQKAERISDRLGDKVAGLEIDLADLKAAAEQAFNVDVPMEPGIYNRRPVVPPTTRRRR